MDKCFICYECRNGKEAFLSAEGAGKEENVAKQLKVIFLLKKLFNVSERRCCLFLQQYGNPSSWVYWCESCSVLVDEAKRLFDQLIKLEGRINGVKKNIERKIISSRDNENGFAEPKHAKTKDGPTEIVRNLIVQTGDALNSCVSFPEVEVKIETCSEESNPFLEFPSDNESMDDFPIEDHIKQVNDEWTNSSNKSRDTRASRSRGNVTMQTKVNKYTVGTAKNLKEGSHQCTLCSAKFSRKEKLKSHLLSHPPPCPYCEEQMLTRDEFKIHVMVHENEEMKRKSCVVCQGDFNEFQDVLNHNCNPLDNSEDSYDSDDSSTKKENSKQIKCSFCEKTFKAKKNLNKHLLLHTDPDNKPFQCPTCGKAFRRERHLRDHEIIHTDSHIVQCTVCDKKLSSTSLSHHMKNHNKEKSFGCTTCTESFTTAFALNRHNKQHREEKPHTCNFCGKKFKKKTYLTEHERIHTGEQPFSCPSCEMRFSNRKTFKNHLRAHTEEPLPHQCSFCDKRFHTPSKAKQHETEHTGEKPFSCSICQKSFAIRKSFTEHMLIHDGEQQGRPFLCTICGKSFSLAKYLKKHETLHSGEKLYACQFCPMKFSKKSGLTAHERIHTGEKPYVCSVCEIRFRFRARLKEHMRTHTGEPAPYPCSFCDKAFDTKIRKTIHERTHTGEKPFSCKICDKLFTTSRNMALHIRIIHDKLPGEFECAFCEKRFHKKYHLQKHEKTHSS